jgi:hypothetical protein
MEKSEDIGEGETWLPANVLMAEKYSNLALAALEGFLSGPSNQRNNSSDSLTALSPRNARNSAYCTAPLGGERRPRSCVVSSFEHEINVRH